MIFLMTLITLNAFVDSLCTVRIECKKVKDKILITARITEDSNSKKSSASTINEVTSEGEGELAIYCSKDWIFVDKDGKQVTGYDTKKTSEKLDSDLSEVSTSDTINANGCSFLEQDKNGSFAASLADKKIKFSYNAIDAKLI